MSGFILSYAQTRRTTGLEVLLVEMAKIVLLITIPSVVTRLDWRFGNYERLARSRDLTPSF